MTITRTMTSCCATRFVWIAFSTTAGLPTNLYVYVRLVGPQHQDHHRQSDSLPPLPLNWSQKGWLVCFIGEELNQLPHLLVLCYHVSWLIYLIHGRKSSESINNRSWWLVVCAFPEKWLVINVINWHLHHIACWHCLLLYLWGEAGVYIEDEDKDEFTQQEKERKT